MAVAVVSDAEQPHLGKFLRASKAFQPGDLLLREEPLLRLRRWQDALAAANALRKAQLFVPEGESPSMRRLQQATASEADPETALFVRSVVHFNSFGAGPSGREQVVFPTLARANHSCLPNCLVDADLGTLRAVRPITIGEEVTVSYLDDAGLLMDVKSRQKELQERYEFRCQCRRCTSVDDTRRFSCTCGGDQLPERGRLRCQQCERSSEGSELFEAEEKAAKSLEAARSGDLEEEDEGHELMKCHRFTSKHPHHQLTFALANEFAFPDPEASQQAVLTILDLVLQMPCQLALETGRDLARRLAKNGKEEPARKALQQAAAVAMVLDGKSSIEEVLAEWGETRQRPVRILRIFVPWPCRFVKIGLGTRDTRDLTEGERERGTRD
ncbi:unnamed protein product [Durusdinium trenchii]|uniref:SET domain-containing protein n=1 Tax=Durusdinium trenchii TaxID=1381693 RepID=A0ABP0NDI8_9DINO